MTASTEQERLSIVKIELCEGEIDQVKVYLSNGALLDGLVSVSVNTGLKVINTCTIHAVLFDNKE